MCNFSFKFDFFFIAIWFHLSYCFYCNIQFHFLVFNSSLFMSLENSNKLIKNLTNYLGNKYNNTWFFICTRILISITTPILQAQLLMALPTNLEISALLNQEFGREKDGNHGKFIISNLVIKNLKDLHCAYMLANQKPDINTQFGQYKYTNLRRY